METICPAGPSCPATAWWRSGRFLLVVKDKLSRMVAITTRSRQFGSGAGEMSVLPLLLLSLYFTGPAAAGNLLAVLPIPIYSHTMPFLPVLAEVANRGHNVTLISPFSLQVSPDGFTHIFMNYTMADMFAGLVKRGVNFTNPRDLVGFWYEVNGFSMCAEVNQEILEHLKPLLPDPAKVKFDLLIAEYFFCQESLAALSYIYKVPSVVKHPGPVTPSAAYTLGNPLDTAYIPHIRLVQSDQMSLLERTWNLLLSFFDVADYKLFILPKLDKIMREEFSEVQSLPYIGDLLEDTALLMTETHFSLNYPRPYSRNILEIGGMGGELQVTLPKDLELYINDSKAGVIYFSWGSHFQADDMNETLAALMEAFSKVEQRVLFKWYQDIPNKPNNVLIKSWFPQNSLLQQEKVLVYVSHCGLNSMYEACYHGVPVVGTPLFVDQPHNALILKEMGMAEVVAFDSLRDGHSFHNALTKVLSQPRYREKAKERSRMLKERPLPVLSEAAYWIEHVMKHGGGQHLRPASSGLPWYSRQQLDVILLLAAIFVMTLIVAHWLVCQCFKLKTFPVTNKKKVQ